MVWPNSDGSVTISQRRTNVHDLPGATNQQADLTLSSSSGIKGGKFVAAFSRPLKVQGSIVSASTKNFIYAVSDQKVPESKYDTNTLQQHLYRGYITLSNSNRLIVVHGMHIQIVHHRIGIFLCALCIYSFNVNIYLYQKLL